MPQTVQIQADWGQTDSTQIDFIKNKPNLYEEWFGTQAEYDQISVKDPNTIYNIKYEAPEYFYVEDISGAANTLSIAKNNANAPTIEVFKSTDTINWESMGSTDTTPITATVPANGKLYLKATATKWGDSQDRGNTIGCTTGRYNVGGHIMSLLVGDNFINATISSDNTFNCLLRLNNNLINAGNLRLPTNVKKYSYFGMFKSCTGLITAPVLPATTLADYCYNSMFQGCTSLTTAPVLPATTLAGSCYRAMLDGCTSLTTAPALPVTTLADSCYRYMFNACTSLTTAPALPAETLAGSCYRDMFRGCTSLTTAPALPATTLIGNCYQGMFTDCTSLVNPPSMSATTIGDSSCYGMFRGCKSLTASPVLLTETLVKDCYYSMFAGCKNIHTVTTYASDISASTCLWNWLGDGVSATGDFYNLGGATYPTGTNGIPSGWTEHTSL